MTVMCDTFPYSLCIVSLKRKKRKINNDLAILSSHDKVSCMIKLDWEENSFVSEVLPLEGNTLSTDKLRLLYLERSKSILKEEDK